MTNLDSTLEDGNTAKENGQSIVAIEERNQNDSKPRQFWSLHTLRLHWSDPSFRKMFWNILLLSWAWSLGEGIFFIQISTTTVAATTFANWYLATIPIGFMLSIGTVYSIFLPRAIARFGYRPPFYFGALMSMIGAGLCIVATWYKLYWLLIIAAGLIGGQVPCTLYYRLVALQFSTKEFAPKVIAMVAAGGCLSAVLGPELAKHMVNALPKAYSGAYLIALVECMLILLTMRIIQFPEIKKAHNTLTSTSSVSRVITENTCSKNDRSIFVIGRQRTFLIAALGGFVSWSSMAIQMSATPLAMTAAGHKFVQVTSAVQYHLLGMFAPSFFSGILCKWFGGRLVMLTGFLIQLTGTLLFQRGFEANHFNLGLIIIGVGWNLGYVGASVLLTKSYREEEKIKTHSLFEAIVMISISISFFSSAFAQQFLGWIILTGRVISLYLAVAIFILVVDTLFVFYKTKDIRKEITVNDIEQEILV
ncbi:unnamed protein product [Rotaria sordida]|uniref:Major facilitator superfamily (MFS) profile domain-containing protein n=1 Tax=Rotaria sordida TaxID=392033 RepID=A0A819KR17_9BILA|nr:unnamed protein product [Rotaria sordida]